MIRKWGFVVAAVGLLAGILAASFGGSDRIHTWITLRTLRSIGPADAGSVPQLVRLLDDRNPMIRQEAAGALGRIGPKARAATPALVRSLNDPTGSVRSNAAWSLGHVGPPDQVIAPLIEAL